MTKKRSNQIAEFIPWCTHTEFFKNY